MSGIKHSKVSTVPDEGDTSVVQPSDWNAEHVIDDGALTIAKTEGLQEALDDTHVPYLVPAGKTWRLPTNKQAVFVMDIVLEDGALLDLEGYLIQL